MLKFLPLILAIIISLSNVQLHEDKPFQKIKLTPAEPTQKSLPVTSREITIGKVDSKIIGGQNLNMPVLNSNLPAENVLRLTWNVVPHAVMYKVFFSDKEIITYTNGIELAVNGADEIFKIVALNFDGKMIKDRIPIASTEVNPKAPLTITEFDKMSYPPIYPVYSWIPSKNATSYEVQLIKDGNVFHEFVTGIVRPDEKFDLYDDEPILEEGEYFWRVRGLRDDVAVTDWSTKNLGTTFKVVKPTRIAALGDSITHGGACSVTPSNAAYSWEFYCDVPIKNLGHSGDTTEQILYRFDRDVLPFQPKILFIFAGVNDFRTGIKAQESIENLQAIRERCLEEEMVPVFITPLPVNPVLLAKAQFVQAPPADWRKQQREICNWVLKQRNFIDITAEMTDSDGNLKAELTTDGLHPDAPGKEIIGKAVENWLKNYRNPD